MVFKAFETGSGAAASDPVFVAQRFGMPPRGVSCYRCPKPLQVDIVALRLLVTMGIVLR